jgi:hypothetical protein
MNEDGEMFTVRLLCKPSAKNRGRFRIIRTKIQ